MIKETWSYTMNQQSFNYWRTIFMNHAQISKVNGFQKVCKVVFSSGVQRALKIPVCVCVHLLCCACYFTCIYIDFTLCSLCNYSTRAHSLSESGEMSHPLRSGVYLKLLVTYTVAEMNPVLPCCVAT